MNHEGKLSGNKPKGKKCRDTPKTLKKTSILMSGSAVFKHLTCVKEQRRMENALERRFCTWTPWYRNNYL